MVAPFAGAWIETINIFAANVAERIFPQGCSLGEEICDDKNNQAKLRLII